MIQKGTIILISLLLGFHCLHGQAAPIKEEPTGMFSLEASMQQEQLTKQQLVSFNQQSEKKLRDVLGYLALLRDTSLDARFRERAEQLAAKAFDSPTSFQLFVGGIPVAAQLKTVELDAAFSERHTAKWGTYYTGNMQLSWQEAQPDQSLTVLLLRQPKQFGKEVSYSWQMLFSKAQ